uniref:LEA III protein isoform 1 n=1 Tax=Solanum tuberosum TaxID=4113 RepID=M1AGF0_SOLTU
MASAQCNPDQSHSQTQENYSVSKVEDAIQRACESAHQKREQNSEFLHQTGEQMMHMAQDAVDGVKNTFGIGTKNNK